MTWFDNKILRGNKSKIAKDPLRDGNKQEEADAESGVWENAEQNGSCYSDFSDTETYCN